MFQFVHQKIAFQDFHILPQDFLLEERDVFILTTSQSKFTYDLIQQFHVNVKKHEWQDGTCHRVITQHKLLQPALNTHPSLVGFMINMVSGTESCWRISKVTFPCSSPSTCHPSGDQGSLDPLQAGNMQSLMGQLCDTVREKMGNNNIGSDTRSYKKLFKEWQDCGKGEWRGMIGKMCKRNEDS